MPTSVQAKGGPIDFFTQGLGKVGQQAKSTQPLDTSIRPDVPAASRSFRLARFTSATAGLGRVAAEDAGVPRTARQSVQARNRLAKSQWDIYTPLQINRTPRPLGLFVKKWSSTTGPVAGFHVVRLLGVYLDPSGRNAQFNIRAHRITFLSVRLNKPGHLDPTRRVWLLEPPFRCGFRMGMWRTLISTHLTTIAALSHVYMRGPHVIKPQKELAAHRRPVHSTAAHHRGSSRDLPMSAAGRVQRSSDLRDVRPEVDTNHCAGSKLPHLECVGVNSSRLSD